MRKQTTQALLGVAALSLASQAAFATCSQVSYTALQNAAAYAKNQSTGGYGLDMWVTFVDETGKVCAVVTTGATGASAGNSEWLGSRVISAQKANTANAFSLDGYAISTANLYTAVQPGGSLFGLQLSNPVDSSTSYSGSPVLYGTANDPLVDKRIGGINVFGGGLALYRSGKKIGAIGVSGDTSCRDHAFAWRVRGRLGAHPTDPIKGITTANYNAAGAVQNPLTGAAKGDELILLNGTGYWNAWGHPACPNSLPTANTANGTLTAN
jgi:uncharacterized protein GlcG (DUF336 family)